MSAGAAPLAGVRVVALEQAVALPFATFVLAELGADVLKIERAPGGDVIRGWDGAVQGLSTGFVWLNAGKRDIAVDLRAPAGREVLLRAAAASDVFVENFAPGVAERLGLGHAAVRRVNERIVYCSLSGFGQDGPYRDRKAYDLIVQGESGLLLTNGFPEAPAKVGVPITDLVGGSTAAILVLAALRQRDATGEGTYLDVSMLDAVVPWLAYYPHHVWHTGTEPPRSGMRHQYTVPYGPYGAADGRWVNLAVASEEHWRRFCLDVLRQPALASDERYATATDRSARRAELDRIVEEAIAAETSDVWDARLRAAGIPAGAVRTVGEALEHPQIAHRQVVVRASSEVGDLPVARFPGAPVAKDRHVPSLSEHAEVVLAELGYDRGEIEALVDNGVVAPSAPAPTSSASGTGS